MGRYLNKAVPQSASINPGGIGARGHCSLLRAHLKEAPHPSTDAVCPHCLHQQWFSDPCPGLYLGRKSRSHGHHISSLNPQPWESTRYPPLKAKHQDGVLGTVTPQHRGTAWECQEPYAALHPGFGSSGSTVPSWLLLQISVQGHVLPELPLHGLGVAFRLPGRGSPMVDWTPLQGAQWSTPQLSLEHQQHGTMSQGLCGLFTWDLLLVPCEQIRHLCLQGKADTFS